MKTISLLLVMIILVLASCTEDETIKKTSEIEKFSISFDIIDGMLEFPSPLEYEMLLDTLAELGYDYFIDWDSNTNFKSLRSHFEENEMIEELLIEDELLAVLLNANYQIKIGSYIFKLFPETENIQVLNACSDLKSNQTFNFSFDDEIVPFLFNGDSLKSINSCKTPSVDCPPYEWDCWGQKIVCKAKYYKAGIYNSIYVEMKLTNCISSGVEMHVYTSGITECVYDKCRSSRSLDYGETKTGCKIYRNLYRKTKKVNECNLEVNYSATSADPSCNNSAYLEVKF